MIIHVRLYSLDTKGKLRVYYIEQEEDKYRMVSGIDGGKEVRSKWTIAKPKNVGKINATTGSTQADSEIAARYLKKTEEGYYSTPEEAKNNPEGNFFQPMLAATWEKVTEKYKQFPLLADPKLDGMRMTETEMEQISRTGNPIKTAGHIFHELHTFFKCYPNVRLDGELYNHEFKEDFNTLMSIARQEKPTDKDLKTASQKLQFHVYDCYHQDKPLMLAVERKAWLREHLIYGRVTPFKNIKFVDCVIVNNQDELDLIKEKNLLEGYEGTITRGPYSVYEQKRSNWLLKHKDFITEEFKVQDIVVGKGNRSGIAGTIEVIVVDKIVGCGIRGSHEFCEKLLKNKDRYIGLFATIRHFGITIDGSLRFPVCIDINRTDL